MNKEMGWVFGIAALVAILFWSFLSYLNGLPDCKDVPTRTVAAVGGCDRAGNCGVLFTDGTSDSIRFPVVGMQWRAMCVRR